MAEELRELMEGRLHVALRNMSMSTA
jgi:hypothetical protein